MLAYLQTIPASFRRPIDIFRTYQLSYLQPDLVAGITVGMVLLPQAIVFALLAGLPPEMGLYSAIVVSIIAALWGSSYHLNSGPTNSASILVFAVLTPIVSPESPEYVAAAGLLAIMIGVFRLLMGVLRLGVLATLLSDSVIVGFTAGAGLLICIGQLRHLLRLEFPASPSLIETIQRIIVHVPQTHVPSLLLGLGTILLMIALQWIHPRLPTTMIGMVGASVAVVILRLDRAGVQVLGELSGGLPPLAKLPVFDLSLIGELSTGALALATIGLVEATSIARSLASQSGQRLDTNQEFIGQGIANIASGFFSGYPCSGSFNRSALNLKANGQTALSNVFAGLFVLAATLVLAPFAASIPRAALASVLFLAAYSMVDWKEIRRIWQGARGDAAIMVFTFVATLLLPLQFAILVGILMSLGYYIMQTSTPRVYTVLPDDDFRHFIHQPQKAPCPQLGIVDILGDLYFGAASHIEDALHKHAAHHPNQRFLLLRMHNVLHCDISGIHALESIVRIYHERGGNVFLTRVREPVLTFMRSTNFYDTLGADHFLAGQNAISYLFYKIIDPAVCIYECQVRAFRECQNLPKQTHALDIPLHTSIPTNGIVTIPPKQLWQDLHEESPPLVLDVREPREFKQGHIPQAQIIPLPKLLANPLVLPTNQPIVLVCRGGRRSTRAAQALHDYGYADIAVLQGGMIAWEAAELLAAVEQ